MFCSRNGHGIGAVLLMKLNVCLIWSWFIFYTSGSSVVLAIIETTGFYWRTFCFNYLITSFTGTCMTDDRRNPTVDSFPVTAHSYCVFIPCDIKLCIAEGVRGDGLLFLPQWCITVIIIHAEKIHVCVAWIFVWWCLLPVCFLPCICRCESLKYLLLQPGYEHMNGRLSLGSDDLTVEGVMLGTRLTSWRRQRQDWVWCQHTKTSHS